MTTSPENTFPMTDARVQLNGQDDHALSIIARVRLAILLSNHPELVLNFMDETMAGDNPLRVICTRYVTVL